MKMTELFLAQLEREIAGTRSALARVPEGKNDWKPHEKSMPLGYLAALVATMPGWLEAIIKNDEIDFRAPHSYRTPDFNSNRELIEGFEASVKKGRNALAGTTDEHLMTNWRMRAGEHIISEQQRYIVIQDTFTHLAHHRGQLTVYLRLTGALVPAIYGPSADEGKF
ncbi:MAG TPA: DinB family protein [Terriglobales bacterium]|jgi:uncharacterized damage-inducible protein DinB